MKGIGLENFSNNCYLNSIAQIFLHIPEMVEYISQDYNRDELSSDEIDSKQTRVVEAFVALFEATVSNLKSGYTSPSALKSAMGKIDPTFDVDEECDAQEFYLAFINALQQGLSHRKDHLTQRGSNVDLTILSNYKLFICQQRHTVVDRLFLGALGNHVTCSACNDISCSYDIFFNVALPLPLRKKKIQIVLYSNDMNRKPIIENVEANIYTETTVSSLLRSSRILPTKNGCTYSNTSEHKFSKISLKNRHTPSNWPSFFLFTLGLSYVRLARQNEFVCNVVDYDNGLILGGEFPRGDTGNCFLVRQYINSYVNNQYTTVDIMKKEKDFKKKYKSSIVSRLIGRCFNNNSRAHHPPVPPLGSHYVGLPFLVAVPNHLQQHKTPFYDWLHHCCLKNLDNIDYIGKKINASFFPFDLKTDPPEFKIIATLKDMTKVVVDSSFEMAMMEHTIAIDMVWNCPNWSNSRSSCTNDPITDPIITSVPSSNGDNSYTSGYAVVIPERPSSSNLTPNKIISCSSFSDPAKMFKIQGKNSDPYDILADLQIFRSRNFDCTLDECIELFFNETIQINNRECSKCNYVGDSEGVVKLAIAPSILTIQLKRFDYQNGGKKTDIFVDIPNKIIIDPRYIENEAFSIHYRLVGMVCHIGIFSFGHYFTLIDEAGMINPSLNAERWIIFDDITVDYISQEKFKKFKSWAYLLFFKRVN